MTLEILTLIMGAIVWSASGLRTMQPNGQNPYIVRYNFMDSEIMKTLSENNPYDNMVFSPLSVKQVLGMMAEGAVGETKNEILSLLRLPEIDLFGDIRMLTSLQSSPVASFANALFLSDELVLDREYEEAVEKYYGSQIISTNFRCPIAAAASINRWVKATTSNMINNAIAASGLRDGPKSIIVNAVRFSGKWRKLFPRNMTRVKEFRTASNDVVDTEMMSTFGTFRYSHDRDLDAQVLELPYENEEYSMIFILPNRLGTSRLIGDMLHVSLVDVVNSLRERELNVEIPKMSIQSSIEMLPHLKNLGLSFALGPQANYSRIAPGATIGSFRHMAKIDVDEEGVEASSVSTASIVPLMIGRPEFVANRPFLFFVYMASQNRILFAGKFEKPNVPFQDPTLLKRVVSTKRSPQSQWYSRYVLWPR